MSFDVGMAEKAVQTAEHLAAVARMRKMALLGAIAWPLFGLSDWFIASHLHAGRLWVYLWVRAIGLALILFASLLLNRRPPPSPRLLRFLDVAIFAGVSGLIAATCLEFRGIASPLVMGVLVVLLCRAALLPDSWQRSLLPVGLVVAAFPAVLGALALGVPRIAGQFHDPEALAIFVLNLLFLVGAGAIVVLGGHLVWRLRRQVFEIHTLGRYRLKQRIGKGSMGEVWSAEHRVLGRDVAVKILRPTGDDNIMARFEREVRATAALCHPNTVRVFDFGVTAEGACYYAMELLRGRDLSQILEREKRIAAGRASALVRQAALALAEAHACGIIHRDLKPSNLFVTSTAGVDEMVKVLDFGLARVVWKGTPSLTQEGWAVGTPAYVSPEVLRGEPAEAPADIYGLGTILYHLIAGSPPFPTENPYQLMLAHLNDPPPPLSERTAATLPDGLERLVMSCLVKDPARRLSSAMALADGLRPYCPASA
jgi:eukaryotic-like serine/threonine-protein kinase